MLVCEHLRVIYILNVYCVFPHMLAHNCFCVYHRLCHEMRYGLNFLSLPMKVMGRKRTNMEKTEGFNSDLHSNCGVQGGEK